MHADQRKLAQVVIEPDLLTPTVLIVAVFAFPAELPLVDVIQLVAAVTIHFQFNLINIGILFMACRTFYMNVFSL